MIWDLKTLVNNPEPEAIAQRMHGLEDDWRRFEAAYKHDIPYLDAEGIHRLLRERDDIAMRQEPYLLYCKLRRSLDVGDHEVEHLFHLYTNAKAKEARSTAFLTIALARRVSQDTSLVEHPSLSEYQHHLERMSRDARYVLSEEGERTLAEMDRDSLDRYGLYGDSLARLRVELRSEGRTLKLSLSELEDFLGDANRERRLEAHRALGRAMGETEPMWTECLTAIHQNHLRMCRARGYHSALEPSLLANDIEEPTYQAMMTCVEENAPLSLGYYFLKARLLGLDGLCDCDLLAPLPSPVDRRCNLKEAKDIVVSAFAEFDQDWGRWAGEMFTKGQVDLAVRPGKEPGASCEEWLSGGSAFVMSNFHGRLLDLFLLAHELGHAIHAMHYGRKQNPTNCRVSLCIAEACGNLAELALAEHLLRDARDEELRREVLCYALDSFAFTMLSIPARMRFEDVVFRELDQKSGMEPHRTASLWREAWKHYHGSRIVLLQESEYSWPLVSQFFQPGGRYYTYPYIFGELLALSILRRHREEALPFHDCLKRFLESGSSRSVEDVAGLLDFDIRKRAFWQGGFEEARGLLRALRSLDDGIWGA